MNNKQLELVLRISSYQSQTLGDTASKTFTQDGGTFGRSTKNDWVLPDPERFVSSQHGEIHFSEGVFYLTDTSTNGILVDQQTTPFGKGNSVPLPAATTLKFADYELIVEINTVDSEDSAAHHDAGLILEDSGFTLDEDAASVGGITAPGFDPLSDNDSLASAPIDESFGGASTTDANLFESDAGSYFDGADAMGAAMPAPSYALDPSVGVDSIKQNQIPFDDDLAASAASEGVSAIPEDWDDTGFDLAPNPVKNDVDKPAIDLSLGSDSLQEPLDVTGDENRDSEKTPAFDSVNYAGGVAAKPQSLDVPRKKERPAGSPDPFDALLAKMGIDANQIGADKKHLLADQLGDILLESFGGLINILRARAELKSEFRMSLTTIRPVENNPLKFSPTVDEALRTFFSGSAGASYLGAAAAVRESIQDISHHQIAMIVGMQAAFGDLMTRLQPSNFLIDSEDRNLAKAALQSINKKSRAWQQYQEFFEETVTKSGNAFQILFGEEFGRAYEEQIQRLDLENKQR